MAASAPATLPRERLCFAGCRIRRQEALGTRQDALGWLGKQHFAQLWDVRRMLSYNQATLRWACTHCFWGSLFCAGVVAPEYLNGTLAGDYGWGE
jgi:hypothetical protein